jgi:hypothetical protein
MSTPRTWLADVIARINDITILKLDELPPLNSKTDRARLAAVAVLPVINSRPPPCGYLYR